MSHIPNAVIGAASAVLAAHYYSHSTLNSLFMESGAPGDVPEGNCETKCSRWFRRCNEDPSVDALGVLGRVLQKLWIGTTRTFIRRSLRARPGSLQAWPASSCPISGMDTSRWQDRRPQRKRSRTTSERTTSPQSRRNSRERSGRSTTTHTLRLPLHAP